MKVLYVADQSSNDYKDHLVCADYKVDSASSIKEANSLLKSNKYDAVLIDLDWGKQGKRLIEVDELRKSFTPVVILARTKDLPVLKNSCDLGITDYLIKEGLSVERFTTRLEFVIKKAVKNVEVMAGLTGTKKKIGLSKKTVDAVHPFICLGA